MLADCVHVRHRYCSHTADFNLHTPAAKRHLILYLGNEFLIRICFAILITSNLQCRCHLCSGDHTAEQLFFNCVRGHVQPTYQTELICLALI